MIYRYFTDLPTLLRTFDEEGNYLTSTSVPPEFDKIESLPELLSHALIFFQKELRDRPITQEIILWDLLKDNELTQELIKASAEARDTFASEKGRSQQHKMLDIPFEETRAYAKGKLDMVLELLELNCGQLKADDV